MAMGNLPPFEEREAYGGFFPALLQTWVGACFRPMEFFQTVGNSQDIGPALLFGVLVGWVSVVLVSLIGLVVPAPFLMMGQREAAGAIFSGVGFVVLMLLLGWLFSLISILLYGLIVHLFLMIVGGAQQGLTMTLRVVAYAQAPNVLSVVPIIGGCIAGIWALVLGIIGLAAAHRTEIWRPIVAFLLFILVCACILIIGAVALGFLGAMQARPVP